MTTARKGILDLIVRWRRLVNDTPGSVWADWEVQEILDDFRTDLWAAQLEPVPIQDSGTTVWKTYHVPAGNLETWDSGTAIWRVYDSQGTAQGTAGYTVDWQRGIVTFTADQKGSVRYLDARSYDLNGAAAHGWRELAASKASLYKFTADGASYERQQWYEHCKQMSAHYESLATSGPGALKVSRLDRADVRYW